MHGCLLLVAILNDTYDLQFSKMKNDSISAAEKVAR